MTTVVDTLSSLGHTPYCNLFDPAVEGLSKPAEYIVAAFTELDKGYDTMLVTIAGPDRSEGQLMEIGSAITRGIDLVVAQHKSSLGKTYIPDIARTSFVWTDLDSLRENLTSVFTDNN